MRLFYLVGAAPWKEPREAPFDPKNIFSDATGNLEIYKFNTIVI